TGPDRVAPYGARWLRLVIPILIILTAIAAAVYVTVVVEDHRLRAELVDEASMLASTLNSDSVDQLAANPNQPDSIIRSRLSAVLMTLRASVPRYASVRLVVALPDGTVAHLTSGAPAGSPGYAIPGQPMTTVPQELIQTLERGEPTTAGPVTDSRGSWISAYAPVVARTDQRVVATLVIDVATRDWYRELRSKQGPHALSALAVILIILVGRTIRTSFAPQPNASPRWLRYLLVLQLAAGGLVLTTSAAWMGHRSQVATMAASFRKIA
ncbi:MAG: hypothetical protein JXM71_08540, partial [Spirochaetales bacterium]|nr:hypothetical protein [Spirochaetales bacterium]